MSEEVGKQESKEVAKKEEADNLPAKVQEFEERMAINFEGVDLANIDLPKVKILHAGALMFQLPESADGKTEKVEELEAIILYKQRTRGWWRQEFSGGHNPPNCGSFDGITGEDTQSDPPKTVKCDTCPKSEWGSDPKGGRGQACKDMRRLFLRLPNRMIPAVLIVPPTSIKVVDNFMFRLLSGSTPYAYTDIRVKLTLDSEKNADDKEYSKLKLSMVEELSETERQISARMRHMFKIKESHSRRTVESGDFSEAQPDADGDQDTDFNPKEYEEESPKTNSTNDEIPY